MNSNYFNAKLKLLKTLAAEFSLANPALAPLLEREMADPDVERLLEAIAYQNGMLRQKLDADFPELITKLTDLILPHYLRPIPASTVIAFNAKASQKKTVLIPSGTVVASAPVDGTPCNFTTTCDLELHPLELIDAGFIKQPGSAGRITLSFALNGIPLSSWEPGTVQFYLSGDHASASELYLLLNKYLKRIVLTPVEGGAAVVLPPENLKSNGFNEDEALLPYPPHTFPGYRLLQEYFVAPEKFLFFELSGWEHWEYRGGGTCFSIGFEFSEFPAGCPRIRRESFALHCVPAVNAFKHQASPILIDHRADRYRISPAGPNPAHYEILSVDSVTGFMRESRGERSYRAFELFGSERGSEPLFQVVREQRQDLSGLDAHLSIIFPADIPPADAETLSIDLTCTNGRLTENLHIGDICHPVSDLPDMVSVCNITAITPGALTPARPQLLQQLTTHLYLNHLTLATLEQLRALLELYVFSDNCSGNAASANLKRISGIESISITPAGQVVAGIAMQGRKIDLKVRQDHFAGAGDLYLFGCVLDSFLGRYASMNSFIQLTVHESMRGGKLQWPTRLGSHLLQ